MYQYGSDKEDKICHISKLALEIKKDVDEGRRLGKKNTKDISPASMKNSTQSDNYENVTSNAVEPSKYSRIDYILLFLLQGNDYLPRLRGVTLHATMRAYSRLVRRFRHKYIVNIESNSFNIDMLLSFFRLLSRHEMYVPTPVQIMPSATEALCG